MEQNKKIIIGIVVVAVILVGGYFGYQYYPKTQKSVVAPEQGIKKIELPTELPQEEMKNTIERNLPDSNTKELSEEEKQKILKYQQ